MDRKLIDAALASGPDAVAALLEAQAARIAALTAEVEELKRLLGRNSGNSSLPPSRDSSAARKQRPKKKGSGRKQGGQPGHPGRHRPMVADPDRVIDHWPAGCGGCGRAFGDGDRVGDGDPVCHQVTEVEVNVSVTEHRRQRVVCQCGAGTLTELPAGVSPGGFAPEVMAAAVTLTAARMSRRDTARLLEDLFGVTISPASVEALVKRASAMLEDPYLEILKAVDDSPVKCADETSWRRAAQTEWVSVSAGEQAALFQIAEHRDRDATRALLGDDPSGVIVSDRYAVYLYIPDGQRQICLAHVARDLIALGERDGRPGLLGRQLADCLSDAFKSLHQPGRDGTDMTALQADIKPHRDRFEALLQQGANGHDKKTARFCDGLLKHFESLWTFTRVPGVPPTNNVAERALRHAVLWRKQSYGTQTEHGDRLVERLLTMRETCRLQGHRLHAYITDVITAATNTSPSARPCRRKPHAVTGTP